MQKFLFVFGFNSPEQIEDWEENRWDEEDSEAVYIEARSPDEALTWGREVAREFINRVYGSQGLTWKHSDYANWIETAPDATWGAQDLARIQIVSVGEHPVLDGERFARRGNA